MTATELQNELRIKFTGSVSEGYQSYSGIQLRIKDHSCNYSNNIGRVVSIVCDSNDATSSKFVSDNISVAGLLFDDAVNVIENALFETAKEQAADNYVNESDKCEMIIDLFEAGIISQEQAVELVSIAKITDSNLISDLEFAAILD